jgi:arsenite/tail-anchored protein-transporting ATPase
VLVVSTDPAHSLGDALQTKLSGVTVVAQPSRTVGAPLKKRAVSKGLLQALELDARRAFARWLAQHRRPLGDILEHGTWLDREDVEQLLDLSIPGIDELVGLLEITRLSRTGVADVIVVDTAPTGHTLRLLAAPETVGAVAGVLDALHEEHRLIRDQLARVGRPEASDRLIELLADQAREMAGQLRDPCQTAVRWVTLPEDLSVAEAADALTALEKTGLHIPEIIINRLLPDGGPCPLCDRRRALEHAVVASIRASLGRGRDVRVVAAELQEPMGVKALSRIGRMLTRSSSSFAASAGSRSSRTSQLQARTPPVVSLSNGEPAVRAETLDALKDAKLLFFAGKGGVGKTTVAAAAALRLALAHPGRRVLLMSTDPAHSLGDVLAARVGDRPAPIAGGPANLRVWEVNAPGAWTARRAAVESALGDLTATIGFGGRNRTIARVSELMDLAPPGVDELFGMLSMFEAREHYDVIVVDTAPTGHALRLLAMPEVVREWVQALLRVLLKYRALARPGQFAAELVGMSRAIRELQQSLRDPKRSRFIVVTRPAEVPGAETDRLARRLRRLHFAVPAVVANATTAAPGRCGWCRGIATAEHRHIRLLERRVGRRSGGCAIIQTPLSAPPPRGARALERWGRRWIVDREQRADS